MKLEVNITKDDYKAFHRFVRFRIQQIHWLYIGLIVLVEWVTWRGHESDTELSTKIGMAITVPLMFFGFVAIAFLVIVVFRKLFGLTFQNYCGPHTFEITDGKLIETNELGRTETNLSQIKKVYETSRHIFIFKNNAIAHIIPKRELGDDLPAKTVIDKLAEDSARKE